MATSFAEDLESYRQEFQDEKDDRDEKVHLLFEDDATLCNQYLKKFVKFLHCDREVEYQRVALCRYRKTWGSNHRLFGFTKLMYETQLLRERFRILEVEWDNEREETYPKKQRYSMTLKKNYDKMIEIMHTDILDHSSEAIRKKAIRRTKKAVAQYRADNSEIRPRAFQMTILVKLWYEWNVRVEQFEEGILKYYERLVESGAQKKVPVEPVYREDIYGPLIEDE